jgi:hypothetical protein
MLSNKGKMAKRAKESYDLQLAKKGMEQAEGSAQPVTSPPRSKALANTVIFTPTKKRT